LRSTFADHAALFDAISTHDPDRAEQIMRDQLRFVAEVHRVATKVSREILRDIVRTG
jgi:DNA-binding FadR family transcriptional regulator